MTTYKDIITFVHDGITYTFKTEPNTLTNAQMWWFEPQVTMYAGSVKDAKTIAKNLRLREKILSEDKENKNSVNKQQQDTFE